MQTQTDRKMLRDIIVPVHTHMIHSGTNKHKHPLLRRSSSCSLTHRLSIVHKKIQRLKLFVVASGALELLRKFICRLRLCHFEKVRSP